MPGAAAKLWGQLGQAGDPGDQRLPDASVWGKLEPGTKVHKGDALFPRLESRDPE
jgi:methionyl-tRNA synthetase